MRSRVRIQSVVGAAAAVLVALTLAACACGGCESTPVPEERKELVGSWQGEGVTLTITAEGHCHYVKVGGGKKELNAPIQRFGDDGFDVGLGSLTTTFKVSKWPYVDGGKWKMTVDGQELVRTYP